MKCFFEEDRECPLTEQKFPLIEIARFCQACSNQRQFRRFAENIKTMKAQLILGLLSMFPKDEEMAKQEYQKLMKRVEEW